MTVEPANHRRHRATPAVLWRDTDAGRTLAFPALLPYAPHLVTTRQLQFQGDSVAADYAKVARVFRCASEQIVRVRQVHGREVLVVTDRDPVPEAGAIGADAVIVTRPGVVASVRVADCVPVLIADRWRRLVAAVHAGWRGTAAGVVGATVRTIEAAGVPPDDLVAVIGPSIGPCCYQVDQAVLAAFTAETAAAREWFAPDESQRWKLDLWRANRAQLEQAGVPPAAIVVAGLCTMHEAADWHSHRREGAAAGRMVAAVQLAGD